jgi:hypothetical protein
MKHVVKLGKVHAHQQLHGRVRGKGRLRSYITLARIPGLTEKAMLPLQMLTGM